MFKWKPIFKIRKLKIFFREIFSKLCVYKKIFRKRKSSLSHECKKIKSEPKPENEEKNSASSLPQPIAQNSESLKNLENLESPDKKPELKKLPLSNFVSEKSGSKTEENKEKISEKETSLKLEELENSEIIILDSFDSRQSDCSDTKVCVQNFCETFSLNLF